MTLIALWIAMSAGLISIGHNVDQWMGDQTRATFAANIRTQFRPDWANWARNVNNAFLTFFDAIYRRRWPELDRALWQSVLFSYAGLALARIVLKAFGITVPATAAILGIAFIMATGGTLFVQAFRVGGQLLARHYTKPLGTWELVSSGEFRRVIFYGSPALFIYTAAAIATANGLGVSLRTITAICLGAALGVPVMMAITLIPDRILSVSPFSALATSILALGLLGIQLPDALAAFWSDLEKEHWRVGSLVLFNLFADMVSLVETRWVLVQSGRQSFLRGIFTMLFIDLLLSGAIFFVLPGIADQNLDVLFQGILFKGPRPWTGLLFWSTFATSALFYVFVLAVIALKALMPALNAVQIIDRRFPLYEHPARLVATVMVCITTIACAAWALFF